jgi:hypothetical protein
MEEGKTYTLARPFQRRSKAQGAAEERIEDVTSVFVREPTAGDLLVIDEFSGTIGRILGLIERLTDLSRAEVHKLRPEDMKGLGEIVHDFLPDGLLGGAAS